jgi:thiamine-phosphate pyrophosphorylase
MIERPRLFLITPRLNDAAAFAAKLEAAVGAADVACVLLRTATRDADAAKAVVRALAPIAQKRGAAVLVEDDARLAVRAEADGVHLAGEAALEDALGALKPDRIVGIGALADRDAAMRAGETGVDYLMFGGPDDPATSGP